MADNQKYIGGKTYILSGAGLTTAQTSMVLTSFQTIDGTLITMSMIGIKGFGTLEPKSSRADSITFTGVTQNADGTATITGIVHVRSSAPYDTVTGVNHSGSVNFIISNTPAFYDGFVNKNDDESIVGLYDFAQAPTVPTGSTGNQVVNANQLNAATFSGASDASTTVTGLTRESVSSDTTIGTVTVTIASPAVFTATSHGLTINDSFRLTTTGALPTGLTVGTAYYVISAGLTTNNFEASLTRGGTAVTTTGTQSGTHTLIRTTPIAVGTLDSRIPTQGENDALVGTSGTPSSSNKYVTNADTDTAATAGALVRRITGGQVTVPTTPTNTTDAVSKSYADALNPSIYKSGTTSKDSSDASTTQVIAHGLGKTPKSVDIILNVIDVGSTGTWFLAQSTYNGTTQSSQSVYRTSGTTIVVAATLTLNTSNTTGTTVGVITYDSTNINIAWTKTGSPVGVYQLLWKAIA